eukprot:10571239-Lingulodinium_polyedra.AAC.1
MAATRGPRRAHARALFSCSGLGVPPGLTCLPTRAKRPSRRRCARVWERPWAGPRQRARGVAAARPGPHRAR